MPSESSRWTAGACTTPSHRRAWGTAFLLTLCGLGMVRVGIHDVFFMIYRWFFKMVDPVDPQAPRCFFEYEVMVHDWMMHGGTPILGNLHMDINMYTVYVFFYTHNKCVHVEYKYTYVDWFLKYCFFLRLYHLSYLAYLSYPSFPI